MSKVASDGIQNNELPPGWVEVGFTDIFDIAGGTQPPKSTFVYEPRKGYVQLLQIRDFGDKPIPTYIPDAKGLKKCGNKDILIARYGASIGRILTGRSGAYNVAMAKVEIPSGVDRKFTLFLLRSDSFQGPLSLVSRSAQNGFNKDDLKGFRLPLPPLAEQKRIADKLEAVLGRVDACRARLDRVPALLKRFRQSVLAAATSGKLTEDWREENNSATDAETVLCAVEGKRSGKLRVQKSEHSFEDISLFDLPRGWSWVKNHRLAVDASNAICAGPFGTIFKAKDFRDEGVPIIFLRHVGEGQYLTKKPGFMDPEVWRRQHQEYSVKGGELLVTKLGDPPGTACIYPNGVGVAMVTPDVMKMEVDPLVADTKFLMFFFNSPLCKDLVKELAFGATRLRIDLTMFKNFPIPLPPREEQTEIVRRVEALFAFADRIEARLTAARAQVERLTPATLAKAFRGELVPQDPTDEPASALLERLASKRSGSPKISRPT